MTMDSCKTTQDSLLDVRGPSVGSLESHCKEHMGGSVGRQRMGLSFIPKVFIKGQLYGRHFLRLGSQKKLTLPS